MVCFDSDGCVFETMKSSIKSVYCPVTVQFGACSPSQNMYGKPGNTLILYKRPRSFPVS
jgi:hypothetical protein